MNKIYSIRHQHSHWHQHHWCAVFAVRFLSRIGESIHVQAVSQHSHNQAELN